MALRWSPGCGCCLTGCEELEVGYTTSSSLSRGEWDGTPFWAPHQYYLIGDVFLQPRVQDNRMCAWRSLIEQQAGAGWRLDEQIRYELVAVVDRIDQFNEWEMYGAGWDTLDDDTKEQAIIWGRLWPGCGIISRNDIMPSTDLDWYVNFNITLAPQRFESELVDYELQAKRVDADTDSVKLLVEKITPQKLPIPAPWQVDKPDGPNGASYYDYVYSNFTAELGVNGVPLDKGFDNPNINIFGSRTTRVENFLAHTKQPIDLTVYRELNLSDVPVDLRSVRSYGRYACFVANGSGRVYYRDYDENDPSTYLEVTDGQVIADQTEFFNYWFGFYPEIGRSPNITDFAVYEADALVEEFVVLGGGLQRPSPGDIQSGKRVSVFCVKAPTDSWGVQFHSVNTGRTSSVDNPTCRVVNPSLCPCPADSEIYPITAGEGLIADYSPLYAALEKYAYTFDDYPTLDDINEDYTWTLDGAETFELGTSFMRLGVCYWMWWLALLRMETATAETQFDGPVSIHRFTIAYTEARLSIQPINGRFVQVFSTAEVQMVIGDQVAFQQDGKQFPRLDRWPAFGIGGLISLNVGVGRDRWVVANGGAAADVPLELFSCDGASITGTFTENGLLVDSNRIIDFTGGLGLETLEQSTDNPVLGTGWTIAW